MNLFENEAPGWFSSGRSLTPDELDEFDASEFIEGDEWDYDWRLCEVPMFVLPDPMFDLKDEDERERIESISSWFSSNGIGAALSERPIVALFTSKRYVKVLDGWHRIAVARSMGAQSMTAVVGFGDPYDGLD